MTKVINIGGRLHSVEQGNVMTGANEILDDTKGKKQDIINRETDAELLRLEQSKQNNLTFDNIPTEDSNNPVKSGGVYAADKALSDAIEAILLLIPSAATVLNKLADKAFVNSSVSTATATFRGTYNVVTDLELAYNATHEQIAAKLGTVILTADNNDYAYVQIPVSESSTDIEHTERYKFNGTAWAYEYDLNTSGFTAAQWEAINSAITTALVQKLAALPTAAELAIALLGKQDNLTFDNIPTIGSNNPVKSSGIKSAINDEKAAREEADVLINQDIQSIQNLIPTGATSSNKLVDVAGMEAAISVISAVIGDLDATFNIVSIDGHITLHVTQENGLITAVEVQSSDIASAADLTLLTNRMTTAEGEINTLIENVSSLDGRVGINERNIAYLQQLYDSLQQSKPVPVTTLPSSGQQQGVIYRLAGTTSYSDYMWDGSDWVLMATYNNAVDPRPKKGSQNLVTSGGVFDNMGALDISELNATENPHTLATYADLSAAIAAIPSDDYKKGGMSVKFVQSSDNKYVQFRFLLSGSFTAQQFANPDNWQGVDDVPTAVSDNLAKSGGVYKALMLSSARHNGVVFTENDVIIGYSVSGNAGNIEINTNYKTYFAKISSFPIVFFKTGATRVSIKCYDDSYNYLGSQSINNNTVVTQLAEGTVYIASDCPIANTIYSAYIKTEASLAEDYSYNYWINNAYLNGSGILNFINNTNFKASKLVKVKKDDEYLVTGYLTATSDCVAVLYDTSLNVVSTYKISEASTIKTFYIKPTSDGYIRACSASQQAQIIKIDDGVRNFKGFVSYADFKINDADIATYINTSGVIANGGSTHRVSKPYYVKEMKSICILLNASAANDVVLAFYDASNNFMSTQSVKGSKAGYRFIEVPNGAVYAHFSSSKDGSFVIIGKNADYNRKNLSIIEHTAGAYFDYNDSYDSSSIFEVKEGDAISIETDLSGVVNRLYYYSELPKDYDRDLLTANYLTNSTENIVPDGAKYACVIIPHADGNSKKHIAVHCTSDVVDESVYCNPAKPVLKCIDVSGTEGKYISKSSFAEITNSAMSTTDFIAVSSGDKYFINFAGDNGCIGVAFFTDNSFGSIVKGYSIVFKGDNNITKGRLRRGFVIPDGITYIKCSFPKYTGYNDGLYLGNLNNNLLPVNRDSCLDNLIIFNDLSQVIIPSEATSYYTKNADGSLHCVHGVELTNAAKEPDFKGTENPFNYKQSWQFVINFDSGSTFDFRLVKYRGNGMTTRVYKDANGSYLSLIGGGDLNPSIVFHTMTLEFDLVSGKDYFVEIKKETTSTINYTMTVSDNDGHYQSWTGAVTETSSRHPVAWGSFKFYPVEGDCMIKKFSFNMGRYNNPIILAIGHSLLEGNAMYGNRDKLFASLLSEHLGGDKLVNCGQGGAHWSTFTTLIDFYVSKYPSVKYLFVVNGQNDRESDCLTKTQNAYKEMISICSFYGIEVIGTTLCPEVSNIESGAWENYQVPTNNWIRSQTDFRYVDIMKAITDANGDRIPDLYITPTDSHPNAEGNRRIFIQCLKDIPDWDI